MLITIYDSVGNPKVDLSPNDSSTQVKEVQGDSVLTLSFTHYEHIELDVDDYTDFLGERFWLTEKYRPRQNSKMEWVYDLKLYGVESMIKRLLVIKTVDNEDNPVFTLTAPPRDHVDMIVKCMNDGMGNITDWKVGQVNGTENIVIDYFGKYCDEALKEIAEKVGAEWWVEGQTVNICKCLHGEPVELGYNKGLLSIDPGTADNVKFYTRLYPVGSSRNIDREKYGFTRLQLPGGQKYVEINADKYGRVDHYETAAFADIYPRRIGSVSSVRTEVATGQDGNPYTIYYFRDNSLPFDPNAYMIGRRVIRVSFQEGSELAGLGEEEKGTYFFEVNFNSTTREFEIITIWPYDNGIQLPGDKLVPKAGDRYILWNLRMPEEYYALAEEEFLAAVNKYNADHTLDISVYKAPTDHVWIEDSAVELTIGRRVRLESEEYFPGFGFRDSRITKITRKVNLPSSMDIEISDALSRTSQEKMSDSIADVRSYAQSIKDSISLPDIIRTGDRTRATDNNLLSALRSYRDLIRKDRDDRTPYGLASDVGFEIGNYLAGVSGGMLGIDKTDGQSFAEVFKLYVRGKAYFETLTVIEAATLAGKQYITPGGAIKCTKVEEVKNDAGTVTAYRCYFLSEQDGEKTQTKIITGDQAISEMFNARTGTANKVSNHRYWRLVTAVDNDAYADEGGNHYGYIDLSATDCETGSDVPQAGDVIDQFGNRTDKTRQAAMIFSTVDADAPSIKLLTGIDSYTLVGRDIISQGYDPVKGHAFFNCFGDVYIGDPDGSTYIKYDQDGKSLIAKLKLTIDSTIDGKNLTDYFTGLIPEIEQEDIEGFVNNIVDPKIEGIQNQIDGVIETWFYNGVPTLTNYPASDWNTDALKTQHLGDLYYDNDTGTAYRFSQKADKSYYWNVITDDAITKALKAAKDAQDTADGKRRTFTSQPTPPYDKGDIWVNATYPAGNTVKDAANGKYVNDILRCNTSRATGSFTIGDWGLASNYTDDTKAQEAIENIKGYGYLKDAIVNGATQFQGGLMLASHIRLGQWDRNNPENPMLSTVYAGMNGIYVNGRTIASWWGGDMVDLFDENDNRIYPVPADAATSLVRMNGSFYLANGNIGGRTDGSGWLAGDNITWDASGAITFGNGIKIDLGGGENTTLGGLQGSIASVDLLLNKLANLFTPYLGNQQKTWAQVNTNVDFDNVRINAGVWTESFLSARGLNNQESGIIGATALADLTDVALSNPVSGQALVYNGTKWVNQAIETGLDTTQLTNYLTTNNYAKKSDIPSLTGYATETWVGQQGYLKSITKAQVEAVLTGNITTHTHSQYLTTTAAASTYVAKEAGKGLSANDFTDTLLSKLNGIEAGANKYVHPTATATTIAAATGKVVSAITVNSLGHVTSVASKTLAAADIPALAISKITGLQTKLDSKLDKGIFDDLFEKVNIGTASAPVYAIKAKFGLYSNSFISARGANPDGGGASGGGLVQHVYGISELGGAYSDTTLTDTFNAYTINSLHNRLKDVEGKYLASASLQTLMIQKNGTTVGTYKPNAAATINISDVASAATLSSHTGNTTLHITAAERTKWNKVVTDFAAITGTDSDTVINKWEEVVAFLATYTEADTLAGLLGNKADKTISITAGTGLSGGGTLAANRTLSLAASGVTAGTYFKTTVDAYGRVTAGSNPTTLAGFGITDAYTKTEAESRYVNVTGDTMTGGLQINNADAITHLGFGRGGYNYIRATVANGLIAFVTNGKTVGSATSDLLIAANNIYAGTNNLVNLGTTSNRWKTVNSVLGNFSGLITAAAGIKIGDCTITYENGGLHFSTGIYSDGFVSARGVNSAGGTGASYNRLDTWTGYTTAMEGYVLSAKLGYELHNRVTTLEGKNYLDALTLATTGSGNAVTAVALSADKKTLTVTKGTTFLTAHQSLANYVTLNSAQTITGVKTFNANIVLGSNYAVTSASATSAKITKTTGIAIHGGTDLATEDDANLRFGSWYGIGWYPTISGQTVARGTNAMWLNVRTGVLTVAGKFVKKGGTSSQFLKADGSVDANTYLTTSSASSTYVKKAGDTMTGALYVNSSLHVNNTSAYRLVMGGGSGYVWFDCRSAATTVENNLVMYPTYARFGKYLNAPYFTASTTTLCTNLNADLLDGYHKESFDGYRYTKIDASALDNNTWYPVVFRVPRAVQTRVRVEGGSAANASWNSRTDKQMAVFLDYSVQGSEWGWVTPQRVVNFIALGAGANGSNCVAGLGQLTNNSWEYVMVRGGAVYNFYLSHWLVPELKTSTFTNNGQSIAPTTTSPAAITRNNARISDNVASAAKLADNTAFKAWGQTFFENGKPKAVDGAMTINYTGETGILLKRLEGGSGAFIRFYNANQDTNFYRVGMFGDGRFGIGYNGGTDAISILTSGNVGIGLSAPTYKLHVNGSARVTSLVIGNCTISYDTETGMLKFDKGIYSTGAVSARGANSAGSSGGLITKVYGSSSLGGTFSDILTETFNAYTINSINTNLSKRITALEGGSALSVTTTGSGNAITAITKSGTVITATKGATMLLTDGSNGTSAGVSALINKLTAGTSTPTDADYYVCQYAGGGTTTTTYHRRPLSALWNYIKAKTDAAYVSALGTSGNYLTWTKNGVVSNITVPFATASSVVNSGGRLTMISGTTKHGAGIRMYEAYNNGYPVTYGNVLALQGSASSGAGELLMQWQANDSAGHLYYRSLRDQTNVWSPWVTVLDSVNYATTLNNKYVTLDTTQTITGTKTFARDAATVMYVENTGDTSTSNYSCVKFRHTGADISGIAASKVDNMLYRTNAAFSGAWMLLDTGNYATTLDSRYYTEAEINAKLTNGSVTKLGTATVGSGVKPMYLNAGTPTASASTVGGTARPMWLNAGTMTALSATVGSSIRPVYLNAGTIAAANVGTAYITPGGNLADLISPCDWIEGISLTNKFEALPASYITVEKWNATTSAWVDAGLTNLQKQQLVSTQGCTVSALSDNSVTGDKIRVTIEAAAGVLYFALTRLNINISTNGLQACKVLLERATIGTPTTFATVGTYTVDGWSGWNGIYLAMTFGGATTQTTQFRKIRLTFSGTATTSETSKTNKFSVINICAYGRTAWNTPNTIGKWGRPYTYALDTFASSFVGDILPASNVAKNLGSATYAWNNTYTNRVRSNTTLYLHSGSASTSLIFYIGDAEKVRIAQPNGYVGIGTTAPAYLLDVAGKGRFSDTLTITKDAAQAHLAFGRAGYNYIQASTAGGVLAFVANGKAAGASANCDLVVKANEVSMGTTNTVNLGTTANRWKGVYSVLGNFTGAVTATSILCADGTNNDNTIGSLSDASKRFAMIFARNRAVVSSDSAYASAPNNTTAAGATLGAGYIELAYATPFIDFHKSGVAAVDYHARIILTSATLLEIQGAALRVVVGMYSDGYVSARGQNTSSDARLKDILRPVTLSTRDIAGAPSVEFLWKKDGTADVGSIAQYWRKLIPQLAPDMPDGTMGLQYGKTALLASVSNAREILRIDDALLVVTRKTESLESRVQRLEEENRRLKRELKELQTK